MSILPFVFLWGYLAIWFYSFNYISVSFESLHWMSFVCPLPHSHTYIPPAPTSVLVFIFHVTGISSVLGTIGLHSSSQEWVSRNRSPVFMAELPVFKASKLFLGKVALKSLTGSRASWLSVFLKVLSEAGATVTNTWPPALLHVQAPASRALEYSGFCQLDPKN